MTRRVGILVVGLVAQVLDHRQLLGAHLRGDLLEDLGRADLVRQRGDDDVAVLALVHRAGAQRAAAGGVDREQLLARSDDLRRGRVIRPQHVLAQVGDTGIRIVQQADAGADHLAQVVRRDVGGHAHRDAHRAVQQHVRHPRRQPAGFLQRAVEVGHPVHRAVRQLAQQRLGDRAELGFGVAHRREALRVVGRAEVALAVDQRVAVRERLRHQHHRFVAGAVAVRVELADHVADGARGLLRLGGGRQAQLAHRVDDAPLHRLQAVAHEGQGAVQHHVHGVVQIRALGIFAQRNLFVVGLQVHQALRSGSAQRARITGRWCQNRAGRDSLRGAR